LHQTDDVDMGGGGKEKADKRILAFKFIKFVII
jgi:hypothetical protein